MLEDMLFEPDDLPDLETLLWKLVHQALNGYHITYDPAEAEMLGHLLKAACPICYGTGQDGMHRDGSPRVCSTCQGGGSDNATGID